LRFGLGSAPAGARQRGAKYTRAACIAQLPLHLQAERIRWLDGPALSWWRRSARATIRPSPNRSRFSIAPSHGNPTPAS